LLLDLLFDFFFVIRKFDCLLFCFSLVYGFEISDRFRFSLFWLVNFRDDWFNRSCRFGLLFWFKGSDIVVEVCFVSLSSRWRSQ
jgi:hypothetical protein